MSFALQVYGCWNVARKTEYSTSSQLKSVTVIRDIMSVPCKYDRAKVDARCVGCVKPELEEPSAQSKLLAFTYVRQMLKTELDCNTINLKQEVQATLRITGLAPIQYLFVSYFDIDINDKQAVDELKACQTWEDVALLVHRSYLDKAR